MKSLGSGISERRWVYTVVHDSSTIIKCDLRDNLVCLTYMEGIRAATADFENILICYINLKNKRQIILFNGGKTILGG